MSAWYSISDEEFNELLRLSRMYRREALKCKGAKAYLAGCITIASALESVLMAMFHLFGDKVQENCRIPTRNGRPKKLLKWTLNELLRVANEMQWLPRGLGDGEEWKARRARIGDYAEFVRQVRNLVHATRYIKDYGKRRVTKRHLQVSLESVEVAVKHLNYFN